MGLNVEKIGEPTLPEFHFFLLLFSVPHSPCQLVVAQRIEHAQYRRFGDFKLQALVGRICNQFLRQISPAAFQLLFQRDETLLQIGVFPSPVGQTNPAPSAP